jgi:DNA processing protein
MPEEDVFFYLALQRIPGLGNVGAKRLLQRFGHARAIFESPSHRLSQIQGIRAQAIEAICAFNQEKEVREELKQSERLGMGIVCWHHENYPQRLREIHDAPSFFYIKGELTDEDRWAVAVVGTRTPTHYGEAITQELCEGLARHGLTVISGLARGIDGVAHQAALNAGGRTVAVLGCGLNVIYPRENLFLFRSIPRHGAIISEFPLNAQPEPHHFPLRNRLISGLSLGVVVVEAAERSGSLITARLAAEQGREVFAVPGPMNSPKSQGTNQLIQNGAKLVAKVQDILEELNCPSFFARPEREEKKGPQFTDREAVVLDLLGQNPVHFDDLVRGTGMTVPELSGCILTLTLKHALIELPGKLYVKRV